MNRSLPGRTATELLQEVDSDVAFDAAVDALLSTEAQLVSSVVVGDMRPRGGRCRWRPLYARVGAGFVILAVAPEAEIDPKGFRRGVDAALQRLADLTEEGS